MNPKSLLLLPTLFAFSAGAFADDTLRSAPDSLDQLIPKLSAPINADSVKWEEELTRLAANAARPGADADRTALATTLCAKASDPQLSFYLRSLFLRQIILIGGSESVAPLTALLADPDPHIREYAREALERNPAPEAGAVLRDALSKGGDTRWQIGLINSLGARRDAKAVSAIVAKTSCPDTCSVALTALGNIATPDAIAALQKALPAPRAGQALIATAGRFAKEKQTSKAAAIYSNLYTANVSPGFSAAALSGLAATDPGQAKKALSAGLSSDNVRFQTAAVNSMFCVYGSKAAIAELHPQVLTAKPAVKLAFLRHLGASDENEALALAGDPDPEVQAGVVETLGRIGSAASVPVLLKLSGDSAREGTPVSSALSVINGPGADDALRQAAAKGDPKSRALAISVLSLRGNTSAASELVAYAAEPNPTISRTACIALKTVGTDAQLMPMLELVMTGKVPSASTAVRGIASRSNARQEAVPKILALAKDTNGKDLAGVLDALSLVAGPEALQSVIGYTHSSDPQVVEAAVRALGNWPEIDAVEPLLKVGVDPAIPEPLRIVALRSTEGIIRAATDNVNPKVQVAEAQNLFKTATRDEEKEIAISVIASIRNPAAADALIPIIADEHLKKAACLACLNLADLFLTKPDFGPATKLALAVQKANAEQDLTTRAQSIIAKIADMQKPRHEVMRSPKKQTAVSLS
jgi:HEAT repeat protein